MRGLTDSVSRSGPSAPLWRGGRVRGKRRREGGRRRMERSEKVRISAWKESSVLHTFHCLFTRQS